ncbi:MAG: glycosyltransferase family 2 protein [Chloroflexi bacterium]|nr:glycosyltransferase family 2 protein [Chloroflexota bacterium]MBI3764399.1 glycosyltransferase family 2 protein [Chloroflexota bacterium]
MERNPALSVIVPAYNEARRIGPTLEHALRYLRALPWSFELIVVDDGSRDATVEVVQAQIANAPEARLIGYIPNRGKGYAVRTGVLASRGRFVVFLDADLSTPAEEIPKALAAVEAGADLVIGSRRHPESEIVVRQPLYRRVATAIFDGARHTIVGLRQYADTQCGFKAMRGDVARALFARAVIDRFMFDVELLYLAERAHLTVREQPVRWADAPGTKVRFVEGVVNMAKDLVRIRWVHRGRVELV